ncbi:MAG: hypothetical protein II671_02485 [Salinivirgaceae bacterium]|nr:hypothetical protein [Salinivirgaceae bacterium]
MYNEVIQAVIDMAQAAAGAKVVLGSLPPDNGLAMTGNASSYPIFLDIGSNEQMNVVCNGKNTQQQAVINQLEAIHASLTRRKDFPSTDTWQIYAIETTASPRLIGREQNSQWLYGSSLLVKFNVKGTC